MKKFIVVTLFCLSLSNYLFSQGTIRGKVSDENGETLIGVTIVLKQNKSVGCATDFDGNYSLKITDSTAQTVLVSFISYQTIEAVVHPVKGEIIIRDFVLKSSSQNIKEVEIVAKATKAKDYYMENMKKKSATTIDYISAESMKKTGDANVTAAVARVSGVSTNGSFITVRGIGDRYVKTCINGSRIPTLDPFTNNIKLDLFPASLVDNVLITKTASPDIPGDWSGAYLSVETKDYPEQMAVNIETTFGYIPSTTFKNVVSSERSSTEWLGFDSDLRDYDHTQFVRLNNDPSDYQEFVALGLGDYYNSLGVTNSTPWSETYYKLGLVQLGLLAPALIDDADAFLAAKTAYASGNYASDAYTAINSDAAKSAQKFSSNWNTTTRKAPINFSQSFSIGNQGQLFGKPIGLIGGFRYGNTIKYDERATAARARFDGSLSSELSEENSIETNGWSALLNAAYKLNSNNSISLLFMPNFNGTNNVRSSVDNREPANYTWTKTQFYEQRKQLVYQLKTEHFIPASKIKLELNASYTNAKSKAPDFKNLQYLEDPISNQYQIGGNIGDGIHRYFRYLTDNLFDARFSAEMPIGNKVDLVRKLKIGGAYQYNYRKSGQYDYLVNFGNSISPILDDDINSYLDEEKFGISSGLDVYGNPYSAVKAFYYESASPANNTFGRSDIKAGFAMVDYSIISALRISGGLRIEQANLFTDVVRFDSLSYPNDDPRRDYASGLPAANPGELNKTSYLPSVNLIYKVIEKESTQINLRLNYSKTVARPSIRELSDVAVFDYEFRSFVFGNSSLKVVNVNNYDLRLESYFNSGDNVSVSVFYKNFKDHIELVNSSGFSWQNVDKSTVQGIELEGKKILTKHFDVRANVTFVKSQTEFVRNRLEISGSTKQYIPTDTVSRPMYGQAPYIVNAVLSYTHDSIGLTAALSYNVQGPRLVIAADVVEIPDVYELPRNIFDFKVTKTLGKHFSASITIRDILNTPIRRSYNYDSGWDVDYDRYRYGTNYIIGILYKL